MWFINWKKKYEELIRERIKVLDYIEDLLQNESLRICEIKNLIRIYLRLSKEDAQLIIYTHEQALKDELLKEYKNSNLCKRRNLYVPIFKKELKKLENKGK